MIQPGTFVCVERVFPGFQSFAILALFRTKIFAYRANCIRLSSNSAREQPSMLNAVFHLDLKRAKAAIASGRLDDAFRILHTTKDARHADGQRLIDGLINALLERSEQHFQQEHWAQARRDGQLAQQLAGGQVEVAELLQRIDAKDVSMANRASRLATENVQAEIVAMVAAGQHHEAIHAFGLHVGNCPLAKRLRPLIRGSVEQLLEQARADLGAGRLDRCEATLLVLHHGSVAASGGEELHTQLNRCRVARAAAEKADYAIALRELRLLDQSGIELKWAKNLADSLQLCIDAVERLKGGPLGLLKSGPAHFQRSEGLPSHDNPNKVRRPLVRSRLPMQIAENQLPNTVCSVLQVDQLGSVLLVQGSVCSVGTALTRCDVTIQTDRIAGSSDRILICRDGEDYFATAKQAFFVNELLADRHLLTDGDTIHIGARGRLKFTRPMAVSNSVVLQLTGSKLKRRDIRSIVLVDDVIAFGRSRGHFCSSAFEPSVMLRPVGGLAGQFLVQQHGDTESQAMGPGDSLTLNDCHFALTPNPFTGDSQRSVS